MEFKESESGNLVFFRLFPPTDLITIHPSVKGMPFSAYRWKKIFLAIIHICFLFISCASFTGGESRARKTTPSHCNRSWGSKKSLRAAENMTEQGKVLFEKIAAGKTLSEQEKAFFEKEIIAAGRGENIKKQGEALFGKIAAGENLTEHEKQCFLMFGKIAAEIRSPLFEKIARGENLEETEKVYFEKEAIALGRKNIPKHGKALFGKIVAGENLPEPEKALFGKIVAGENRTPQLFETIVLVFELIENVHFPGYHRDPRKRRFIRPSIMSQQGKRTKAFHRH